MHVLVVHKIFLVDAHKKIEATDATVFVTRSHRRALQRQSHLSQFWNYVRARTRFYEMKSYFESVRRRRAVVMFANCYGNMNNKYIFVFRSFSKS